MGKHMIEIRTAMHGPQSIKFLSISGLLPEQQPNFQPKAPSPRCLLLLAYISEQNTIDNTQNLSCRWGPMLTTTVKDMDSEILKRHRRWLHNWNTLLIKSNWYIAPNSTNPNFKIFSSLLLKQRKRWGLVSAAYDQVTISISIWK